MKKEIKYLLIEVDGENKEILKTINEDKIIDECIILKEIVDKIGVNYIL